MTHNIYLDETRKKIYMSDFNNLLNCEMEFWRLDENLKDALVNINTNKYVQTLYSKRHNRNDFTDKESYLKICYCQEIELKLLRIVVPDLVLSFNQRPETILYYDFSFPQENGNYAENSNNLGFACTDNKDYFRINHISIYLNSPDLNIHDDFWKYLENKLVNLNPD